MSPDNHDDLCEATLRRRRPRVASDRLRNRLLAAEPHPAGSPKAPPPGWPALLLRIAFACLVIGWVAFLLLPERHSDETWNKPLPPPPGRAATPPRIEAPAPVGMMAFTPVETNRIILSSQPIGTMTGPDETPLELRRVRWLDFSRSESLNGDQLVIGYPNEQIIPVALTIH